MGIPNGVCFLKVYVRSTPLPVTVANEGLGWDPLLKMVHNPGGDWHPGRGVDLRYMSLIPHGPSPFCCYLFTLEKWPPRDIQLVQRRDDEPP